MKLFTERKIVKLRGKVFPHSWIFRIPIPIYDEKSGNVRILYRIMMMMIRWVYYRIAFCAVNIFYVQCYFKMFWCLFAQPASASIEVEAAKCACEWWVMLFMGFSSEKLSHTFGFARPSHTHHRRRIISSQDRIPVGSGALMWLCECVI